MARATAQRRAGFTLVEAATASIVLGLLAGATLSAVSAASGTWQISSDRARARQLAGELLAEVCVLAYKEPGSTTLGRDSGELNGTVRTAFDDVDDFAGWTESPPRDRDGKVIAGVGSWVRTTSVEWVSVADPATPQGADGSVKLISISVSKGSRVLARVTSLRSEAWDGALMTGRIKTSQATVASVVPPEDAE